MDVQILGGRLTRDPEVRVTNNGKSVANFTVAINKGKNEDGSNNARFQRCVAWGKTAEMLAKYFVKGSMIYVKGEPHDRTYTDKNGVEKNVSECWIDEIGFCGSSNSSESAPASNDEFGGKQVDYGDIPF